MNKLLIIDGSSILTTCFFATVPREYYYGKTPEEKQAALSRVMKTSNGICVNGVYTAMKSLTKLLNSQKPSHLAVAWDITRDTFRRRIYPEYKGNRAETVPELKSQFILMQELLEEANIQQFMDANLEADDLIGSLAKQFEQQLPTYIYTKDQDCLQLVSDYTRLWLNTGKADELKKEYNVSGIPDNCFEFTPYYVKEVYGLDPIQIIDKKALEGDTSDNIPGVKGVGEKACIPLLQEYGTIEMIYEALEDDEKSFKENCKALGVRTPVKALKEGKESAFLSKNLATIRCKNLEVTLDELTLAVNEIALNRKYKEFEFKSLVKPIHEPSARVAEQGCLF
ncbi:dna polymerase i [hydrocarbon metagenome]|uniref:Dna polymerase i n=1 Tax=hydrocarbon metagenome TaxID=938273 RepID=A0A0W8E280_9ZZZZ